MTPRMAFLLFLVVPLCVIFPEVLVVLILLAGLAVAALIILQFVSMMIENKWEWFWK